jgi:hypothetical protein
MRGRRRICDSENMGSPIELRETMFGTGDKFYTSDGSECGCLWIVEQPVEIAKHYPDNYDA